MKIVVDVNTDGLGRGISYGDALDVLRKIAGTGSVMLVSGHVHGGLAVEVTGVLTDEAHDGYKPDGTCGHVHREVIRPLGEL